MQYFSSVNCIYAIFFTFYFHFTPCAIFLLSFLFWLMLVKPYCFADIFFFLTSWSPLQARSVRLVYVNEICFARLQGHRCSTSQLLGLIDANQSGWSGPDNLATYIISSEGDCAADNGPPATSPCALVRLVCGVTWREHVRSHSACDGHNVYLPLDLKISEIWRIGNKIWKKVFYFNPFFLQVCTGHFDLMFKKYVARRIHALIANISSLKT